MNRALYMSLNPSIGLKIIFERLFVNFNRYKMVID